MTRDQYTNLMNKLEEIHAEFSEHKGAAIARIDGIEKRLEQAGKWENAKVLASMIVMGVAGHHPWKK